MTVSSFFSELRRRNVLPAGAFYAAAGWLLVRIATQVFPFFDIPNRIVKLVVIAVVVGFPVALVLAWFHELTSAGLKRESEIGRSDAITHATSKRLDRWIIVALSLAVVSLLANSLLLRKEVVPALQFWSGEGAAARENYALAAAQAKTYLDANADDTQIGQVLAIAHAGLGDKTGALREAQWAIDVNAGDAVMKPNMETTLAQIQAHLGDPAPQSAAGSAAQGSTFPGTHRGRSPTKAAAK